MRWARGAQSLRKLGNRATNAMHPLRNVSQERSALSIVIFGLTSNPQAWSNSRRSIPLPEPLLLCIQHNPQPFRKLLVVQSLLSLAQRVVSVGRIHRGVDGFDVRTPARIVDLHLLVCDGNAVAQVSEQAYSAFDDFALRGGEVVGLAKPMSERCES